LDLIYREISKTF
jgi:hypothetical protein